MPPSYLLNMLTALSSSHYFGFINNELNSFLFQTAFLQILSSETSFISNQSQIIDIHQFLWGTSPPLTRKCLHCSNKH